jgi:spermidine/putrescine transport system ATP-binding protein/putrescine transport system ATP-binding protein
MCISIERVSKTFGDFVAVDDVSLDIKPGEFFSLLGPSGCGKTTLLRILGGFELPSSGQVFLEKNNITTKLPNLRPINTVFQSYALFPHLNIEENIGYGLRTISATKEEKRRLVEQSLAMVRLTAKAKSRPSELSGGQRQRVALARALARQPKVLLLDEPLSALDKQLREEMQFELRELQRRVAITFIFVTHDQDEALALSDRVAVMSVGKVLQVDTPSDIYEFPNSRTVAAFIGTMNFFDGVLRGFDNGLVLVDAGPAGQMSVPHERSRGSFKQGDAVVIAVRPEKIRLGATLEGASLQGKIVAHSYMGERSQILVNVEGLAKPVSVAVQNAGRNTSDLPDVVGLNWEPENAVLLPASGACGE